MSRYAAMFERLGRDGAFGAFIMLGDPDPLTSALLLDALVAAGADMIEVGIPFSDPVADGPVVQAAATKALRHGVTPSQSFDLLRAFRGRHSKVPIGILTYANLVVARGREAFARDAAAAGVDSLLVADVPIFEAQPFAEAADAAGIDPIFIAAPNTPEEVLAEVARRGRGYTYCVARAGVTGADADVRLDHGQLFKSLERLGAPPPILGFGISKPEHVTAALDAGAAGVISGSAIVERIAQERDKIASVSAFVRTMKRVTRRP